MTATAIATKTDELLQRLTEAHSSQTGEAAKDLRIALSDTDEQELTAAEAEDLGLTEAVDPVEEALAKVIGARGKQKEPLVLRLHRYAEGANLGAVRHQELFIMDVLDSCTTYQTYWRLGIGPARADVDEGAC